MFFFGSIVQSENAYRYLLLSRAESRKNRLHEHVSVGSRQTTV